MSTPQPPPGAGHPIQQPPPHAAPTQQFEAAGGGRWQPAGPPQKPPQQPVPKVISVIWVLGLVSIAATVLGLTVDENGTNAWHTVHAWGGVAIVGAVLTLAPALAGTLNLTPHRAWQLAACGAGALLLFWVLFVLPEAGTNTSLVVTIGAAAGIIAAWIAPGREVASQQRPDLHSW